MKLKQALSVASAGLMALMSLGTVASAQQTQQAQAGRIEKAKTFVMNVDAQSRDNMVFASGEQTFEFNGGEFEYHFGDAQTIKGAPFSAQIAIENTQTLANGVHISHKLSGAVYRDSEGRTRREIPSEGGTPEAILVRDPVANVTYMLNGARKTVLKLMPVQVTVSTDAAGASGAAGSGEVHLFVNTTTDGAGSTATAVSNFKTDATIADTKAGKVKSQTKTESLGTQVMEGVQAEGTRSTITIPAGAESNDQAFDIVSEKWYSPELQMVVMTRHSDPRSGENVYRLTGITRAEPASSLFQPPSDFTVVDPQHGEPGVMVKRMAKPRQQQ